MKYKKSQIGATLTWFFAFIIVFFIIIIFLTGVSVLSVKKAISPGKEGIEKYSSEDLRANKNLINFLNNPIEIEGKTMKTFEAILFYMNSDDAEKKLLVGELTKKLKSYCSSYRLLIPQGLMTEQELLKNSDSLEKSVFSDSDSNLLKWTTTMAFNVNNDYGSFKIKYKEFKKC